MTRESQRRHPVGLPMTPKSQAPPEAGARSLGSYGRPAGRVLYLVLFGVSNGALEDSIRLGLRLRSASSQMA